MIIFPSEGKLLHQEIPHGAGSEDLIGRESSNAAHHGEESIHGGGAVLTKALRAESLDATFHGVQKHIVLSQRLHHGGVGEQPHVGEETLVPHLLLGERGVLPGNLMQELRHLLQRLHLPMEKGEEEDAAVNHALVCAGEHEELLSRILGGGITVLIHSIRGALLLLRGGVDGGGEGAGEQLLPAHGEGDLTLLLLHGEAEGALHLFLVPHGDEHLIGVQVQGQIIHDLVHALVLHVALQLAVNVQAAHLPHREAGEGDNVSQGGLTLTRGIPVSSALLIGEHAAVNLRVVGNLIETRGVALDDEGVGLHAVAHLLPSITVIHGLIPGRSAAAIALHTARERITTTGHEHRVNLRDGDTRRGAVHRDDDGALEAVLGDEALDLRHVLRREALLLRGGDVHHLVGEDLGVARAAILEVILPGVAGELAPRLQEDVSATARSPQHRVGEDGGHPLTGDEAEDGIREVLLSNAVDKDAATLSFLAGDGLGQLRDVVLLTRSLQGEEVANGLPVEGGVLRVPVPLHVLGVGGLRLGVHLLLGDEDDGVVVEEGGAEDVVGGGGGEDVALSGVQGEGGAQALLLRVVLIQLPLRHLLGLQGDDLRGDRLLVHLAVSEHSNVALIPDDQVHAAIQGSMNALQGALAPATSQVLQGDSGEHYVVVAPRMGDGVLANGPRGGDGGAIQVGEAGAEVFMALEQLLELHKHVHDGRGNNHQALLRGRKCGESSRTHLGGESGGESPLGAFLGALRVPSGEELLHGPENSGGLAGARGRIQKHTLGLPLLSHELLHDVAGGFGLVLIGGEVLHGEVGEVTHHGATGVQRGGESVLHVTVHHGVVETLVNLLDDLSGDGLGGVTPLHVELLGELLRGDGVGDDDIAVGGVPRVARLQLHVAPFTEDGMHVVVSVVVSLTVVVDEGVVEEIPHQVGVTILSPLVDAHLGELLTSITDLSSSEAVDVIQLGVMPRVDGGLDEGLELLRHVLGEVLGESNVQLPDLIVRGGHGGEVIRALDSGHGRFLVESLAIDVSQVLPGVDVHLG